VRPLAIQAVGAFTGSGTSATRAIGSVRLGLKFFGELPSLDAAGEPLIGATTPIDCSVEGVARLATMAAVALGECAEGCEDSRAAILLCLPPPVDGSFVPADVMALLSAEAPFAGDRILNQMFSGGRETVFEALAEAERLLSTRAVSTVYLGGVDSLVDREPLDRALRAGLVKAGAAEGFVPGEGAAFIRLGIGAQPGALSFVAGVAVEREPYPRRSSSPNTGDGLARAGRAALAAASLPSAEVGLFFHDASGDRFGFREAAMALVRLRSRAEPTPQVWAPATCTGEMGAAYGPFALAAAATFLHRGVCPGPAALVLGSGVGAAPGAAVVTAAPAPSQRRSRR
jgi:3-oxoacyl-[acyl-carrier-protein] synthase-1